MENYHDPKSEVQVHPMWKTRKRKSAKRGWKKEKYYTKCQTRWNDLIIELDAFKCCYSHEQ